MPTKVILTVTRGKLQNQEFVFNDRTTYSGPRKLDHRLSY
jgi:hypothetical protein